MFLKDRIHRVRHIDVSRLRFANAWFRVCCSQPTEQVSVVLEDVGLGFSKGRCGVGLSFRLVRFLQSEQRTRELFPFRRAQVAQFLFYFGQRHAGN